MALGKGIVFVGERGPEVRFNLRSIRTGHWTHKCGPKPEICLKSVERMRFPSRSLEFDFFVVDFGGCISPSSATVLFS